MAKRKNDNIPLSEALNDFIKKNKLQHGIDKVNAREAWVKLMGNGVNNYTTAIELRNETLYGAALAMSHTSPRRFSG